MSDVTTGEIVVAGNDVASAIAQLNSGQSAIATSIEGDDFAARKAVLSAVSSSVPLADNLSKPIQMKHYVVQEVWLLNEQTQEIAPQPRVVIIDADGVAYHATSAVVFRDVQNIVGILGKPSSWPEPVAVTCVKEGKAPRAFYTLKLV